MIYTETVIINGRQYVHTYSDAYTLLRDGVEYDEAIDPVDSGRTYSESTTLKADISAEEALKIITEGTE